MLNSDILRFIHFTILCYGLDKIVALVISCFCKPHLKIIIQKIMVTKKFETLFGSGHTDHCGQAV